MAISTTIDPARFQRLLKRWNTHQDLRRSKAPVAKLARSRCELDAARAALRSTPSGLV